MYGVYVCVSVCYMWLWLCVYVCVCVWHVVVCVYGVCVTCGCVYSMCVLHVAVCVYSVCMCSVCVCRWECVVCFDPAEIAVQVMEASCSATKQIVFLPNSLACCGSSEPGSLYAPWGGNSFRINTVCEADRLLTQTLVLFSIYHKFLRKSSENIICAPNTSVGVSCRREKMIWVLNLWKYHIISFYFYILLRSRSGYISSIFFPGQRPLVPLSLEFPPWTITQHCGVANPTHTCCPHDPMHLDLSGGEQCALWGWEQWAWGQQRELSVQIGAASKCATWLHILSF